MVTAKSSLSYGHHKDHRPFMLWGLNVRNVIREMNLPALSFVIVVAISIFIVNRYYPMIGHDYRYHIPRMLDTYLYNRLNGLRIQWYTPAFGGGIPAYPNPLHVQYSLPQVLMFIVNPWWSLLFSFAVYSMIGSASFYFFLKDEVGLAKNASILGASFILANGFIINHAIAGHIGYQQFPLLGLILFLGFSKRVNLIPAGILLGITGALIIHQAGFYLAVIFLLSLAILLPLIYLLKPEIFSWKRLGGTFLTGILLSVLLSASKLNAIMSFMRFFPRTINDFYDKTYFQGMVGLGAQLLGGMIVIPYYLLSGRDLNSISLFFQGATGSPYNIWETDISLSPSLLILLAIGFVKIIIRVPKNRLNFQKDKRIGLLLLILGIWLASDLSLSQGWLYRILKTLPVMESLHVNVRFASAFIFPLSILGASIFHEFYRNRLAPTQLSFLFLYGLTVIALFIYVLPGPGVQRRSFNIKASQLIYSQIEQGDSFPVNNISNVTDDKVFRSNSSSLYKMNEAIFGYDLEFFKPSIHPGSIFEVDNGYYNMTNPASYVFPKENELQPFEHFRVDQLQDLTDFVNRKPLGLRISLMQQVSNFVTVISLICIVIYSFISIERQIACSFQRTIQ